MALLSTTVSCLTRGPAQHHHVPWATRDRRGIGPAIIASEGGLRRREKGLAETAALRVLGKSAQELLG
jgi:hypothetical protein